MQIYTEQISTGVLVPVHQPELAEEEMGLTASRSTVAPRCSEPAANGLTCVPVRRRALSNPNYLAVRLRLFRNNKMMMSPLEAPPNSLSTTPRGILPCIFHARALGLRYKGA